jgi:hypothetical protein
MAAMPAFKTALGAVFEIEPNPYAMRVIAFDDAEVMYDVWWPHREAWGMARLLGHVTYYRLPRDYVEANARCIRTDPLSEMELRVHRPELPFAVAQRKEFSWYEPSWKEGVLETAPVLAASNIYLAPFGPRDSAKQASLLAADDREAFTEAELLTKARILQAPFVGDVRLTEGVGIYRAGIKKRLPSYYIWGARSRADSPSAALSHAAKFA